MCTTILVGNKATADGSFLVARNADSDPLKAQHMVVHPERRGQKGMYRTKDYGGATAFEYPLPKHSLRYTTVPNWKTGLHGGVGFNSAGVGVTATESIFARDDALKLDPYNKENGITEDDIPDIILSRAKTARAGIELLGSIIEEIGAGEGFGIAVADSNEVWYLETGTGHQWMAQKLPEGVYFASANQGRLQDYRKDDPNVMGSASLVEWAEEHGFYDPHKDGDFNFSKAYTRDDFRDRVYNDPRVFQIMKSFTPALKLQVSEGRKFPVFGKPEKPLTLEDVKAMQRDHFQAGSLKAHDPYSNGLNGDEPYRPVSVFRCYESHVMQIRPDLPEAIAKVTYIAFGMSDLGVYIPFYYGLKSFPKEFSLGTDKADSYSAYWRFRKLQTFAMTDYPRFAPVVKEAYAKWEAETAEYMKEFEKTYLKVAKKHPKRAKALLQEFNTLIIRDAELLTEDILNELFTMQTVKIQETVPCKNNKKKD